jgi:hypothetical protein
MAKQKLSICRVGFTKICCSELGGLADDSLECVFNLAHMITPTWKKLGCLKLPEEYRVERQDINRNSEPGMILSEVAYTQPLLIILYFIFIFWKI